MRMTMKTHELNAWMEASKQALKHGTRATAPNGDKWTGDIETDGQDAWFVYLDCQGGQSHGCTYESQESPAIYIEWDNAVYTNGGIQVNWFDPRVSDRFIAAMKTVYGE